MALRSHTGLSLALTGACALAACGDASVGNPRGIDYGYGGGGSTGSPGSGDTGGSGSSTPSGGADAGSPASGGGPTSTGGADAGASAASDAGASTSTGTFTVSVDKPQASVDLADSVVIHVSITPNGYSGTVSLAMTTGLSDVTATFASESLSLDGETPATTDLTLTTATSSPIGDDTLSVTATSSAGTVATPIALTVNPSLTITVPANVDQNGGTTTDPVTTAFGSYPIHITAPANMSAQNTVTVRFYNADTIAHEIHAESPNQGFGHDPGPFPAMSMDPYIRNVNTTGTYDFYLHDQGGPSTIGRLIIQ